jgi:response regulator RpfG family c-di-GMP phosphodiesterase
MPAKVLFVDDEPRMLVLLERQLRASFPEADVRTAGRADAALLLLEAEGPFAAIVTDYHMPGRDGVQLLAEVRLRFPDTVRLLLTGDADQRVAVDAVNEGSVFRFLAKPCSREGLARAVGAAVEQYRLVTAERELLEQTLRGTVQALAEVLEVVSPAAFGRSSRCRTLVRLMAREVGFTKLWELEVAALLSQVGCIAVPDELVARAAAGLRLTAEEAAQLAGHPEVARQLLGQIPRLEGVREIIAYQLQHFDGTGSPGDGRAGSDLPLGARLLHVALAFADGMTREASLSLAFRPVAEESGRHYDPRLVAVLAKLVREWQRVEAREIRFRDLRPGMVLAADVLGTRGAVLVSRGVEITPPMRERLQRFAERGEVAEPLSVFPPRG